jgi:MFS family permease
MNRNERQVLFLTTTGHGLCHVFVLIFPAVLGLLVRAFSSGPSPDELFQAALFGDVFARHLWRGYSILSAVGTVGYAAFGFCAVPWGALVDRLGPVRIIRAFFFGAAGAMGLIAVSTSLTMLAVGMFCLGLFAGAYHPSGLSLISLAVRAKGRAMGYHGMAGNLGLGLAPFLAASLAAAVGWRWTYGVFALVALAVGGATFVLSIRVSPREIASNPAPRTGSNPGPPAGPVGPAEHHVVTWRAFVAPSLLILFGVAVFNGLAYRGTMTFLPTMFEYNFNHSLFGLDDLSRAGMLATIVLLVGIGGQYASGRLIDRIGGERIMVIGAALVVPFLLLMAFTAQLGLLLVSLGFALFHFSTQPAGNFLVSRYTPDRIRGLAYGVYFSMTFGMGSAGAALSGWLFDRWGFKVLLSALAGLVVVAALLAWCLYRRRDRAG